MSIEAMKQALEALEEYQAKGAPFMSCDAAVAALRAAIEQAEKRQWVRLTDEEVHEGFCHVEYETPNDWNTDPDDWCQQFARYLEAKLKEKNHG
jgi:hypothetical protein